MSSIEAKVSGIYFYPVKSCAGTETGGAYIEEKGLPHDRHWMVVNPNGKFLTQRELPKMALIKPRLEYDRLVISGIEEPSVLEIPIVTTGERRKVEIWGNYCEAMDDGALASEWLSQYLGVECYLVHMANDFVREKKKSYGRFEFADSYPFLIVSEESLEDLNEKIAANGGQEISMDRFRPNIVVNGCAAFAEDSWAKVTIGEVDFDVVRPCIRCPIPTIDQKNSQRGKEPLKTLASYRKVALGGKKSGVIFAQKAVHLNSGLIAVGDEVNVLKTKSGS